MSSNTITRNYYIFTGQPKDVASMLYALPDIHDMGNTMYIDDTSKIFCVYSDNLYLTKRYNDFLVSNIGVSEKSIRIEEINSLESELLSKYSLTKNDKLRLYQSRDMDEDVVMSKTLFDYIVATTFSDGVNRAMFLDRFTKELLFISTSLFTTFSHITNFEFNQNQQELFKLIMSYSLAIYRSAGIRYTGNDEMLDVVKFVKYAISESSAAGGIHALLCNT